MRLQTVVDILFPPSCIGCETRMVEDGTFCPQCRGEVALIFGAKCVKCALPLPGEEDGQDLRCDACMADPPPWGRAAAPFLYEGKARKLILAYNHNDRTDLAPHFAPKISATSPRH